MSIKISKPSFIKVVRNIMNGRQKSYEPCCSECRWSLQYMVENGLVKTDDSGYVRLVPKEKK